MPVLFLEVARGLAALWVFAFHIIALINESSPQAARLAAFGYWGVPLFFVISGYCLYSAAASSIAARRPPTVFLRRRFLRIFPPYWMSIVVVLLLPYLIEAISALKTGTFVVPTPGWIALGPIDWLQFATLTRIFTAADGNLQAAFTVVNAVYWTLAIEFQFYLVMFAVLYVPRWWKHVLGALFVVSLLPGADSIPGLFLPFWPAFCIGLALRALIERGWRADVLLGSYTVRVATIALLLLLGSGCAAIYNAELRLVLLRLSPSSATVAFALYAAALLWLGGGLEAGVDSKGFAGLAGRLLLRPFILLGASSYSLYLLHGKIYHLPELFVRQLISPNNTLYPVLTMGGTSVVCYLFYRFAERPFMSARYRNQIEDEIAITKTSADEDPPRLLGR